MRDPYPDPHPQPLLHQAGSTSLASYVAQRLRLEDHDEALDVVQSVVALLATQIVRGFADDARSQAALQRLAIALPPVLHDCVTDAEAAPHPLPIVDAHQRLASVWNVPLDVARARCNTVVELLAQGLSDEDWEQLREQLHAPWRDYLERLRIPLGTELGERGDGSASSSSLLQPRS